MSWILDGKTQGIYQSANPNTVNHTCGPYARLLVVSLFVTGSTTRTGGSPTYNGVTMAQGNAFYRNGAGDGGVEQWYLLYPPIEGSYTVSVPNSNSVTFDISVASFYPEAGGCVQDSSDQDQGTSVDPGISTFTSADYVLQVGATCHDSTTLPAAGIDSIVLHTLDATTHVFGSCYNIADTAGANYIDFDLNVSDDWAMTSVAFEETGVLHVYNSPGNKSVQIVTP